MVREGCRLGTGILSSVIGQKFAAKPRIQPEEFVFDALSHPASRVYACHPTSPTVMEDQPMSGNVCVLDTLVLSDHDRETGGFAEGDPVFSYVVNCMRQPDEGSEFEAKVRPLLEFPDAELYARLRVGGYDGLLFLEAGEIVGHMFFQVVEGCLHMFSMFLVPRCRGQRMSGQMIEAFLNSARNNGAARVRFGKGQHPKMLAALRYMKSRDSHFCISVERDGFATVHSAQPDS